MGSWNFFESMQEIKMDLFIGDMAFIHDISKGVACIFASFALVSFYNKYCFSPMQRFNMKSLLRIFVVLLCVCNFNTVVLLPLDGVTHNVSRGFTAYVNSHESSLDSRIARVFGYIEDTVKEKTFLGEFEDEIGEMTTMSSAGESGASYETNPVAEAEASVSAEMQDKEPLWERWWEQLKSTASTVMGAPVTVTSSVLAWVISILIKVVRFILICISGVYTILLGLLGPMVFAISLIPTFESNIGNWFARYIQISFWTPMVSFIDYICFRMKGSMLQTFENSSMIEQLTFPTFHLIMLELVSLCLLLAIPKVCSWLIQSSGASEVNNSMVDGAARVAQVAVLKK